MWQAQTAHQSIKEYEFDDYIFALATEIRGKTTIELEDELEENCMTVYVRKINGMTNQYQMRLNNRKQLLYRRR